MKRLFYYFLYLFLVWGSFRYFVRLPDVIEELWFKPVIWLVPLFWWSMAYKGKERINMFGGRGVESVLLGVVVGVSYFVFIRKFNINIPLDLNLIGVSLATVVTEELAFSGFVAGYLEKINKGKWFNFLILAMMISFLRLPILLFVFKAGVNEMIGALFLAAAFGMINAWIRIKTGNVFGSMIARMGIMMAILG